MREDSDVAENMNFTSHDYTDNFMYNNVWDLNVDSFAVERMTKGTWYILIFVFLCFIYYFYNRNPIYFPTMMFVTYYHNFFYSVFCLFVFNYGFLSTIQIINTISAMGANVIQISVLPLFEWAYFSLKCYLLYVKIE